MMNPSHAMLPFCSALRFFGVLTFVFLVFFPANINWAADLCKAAVLRDVAAVENPSTVMKKGSSMHAVTGYLVNKRTGVSSFCSHGGFCYPTHVTVNGKKLEALKLLNCKVGKPDDSNDDEEIWYSLEVDRSKNSASDLRKDDLENKFLEMGLCSACADNAAEYYLKKPSSPCARLAKQALEGDPDALKKLVSFPDYCWWKY